MTPIESGIIVAGVGAVAGGVVTHFGRAYFDWLKNGRANGQENGTTAISYGRKCSDHEGCVVTLEALKIASENHGEKLKAGDERMMQIDKKIDGIKGSVANIDKNVAVLAQEIQSNKQRPSRL